MQVVWKVPLCFTVTCPSCWVTVVCPMVPGRKVKVSSSAVGNAMGCKPAVGAKPGGNVPQSLALQEDPEAWGQPGGEVFWAGAWSSQPSVDPEESCAVSLLLLPGL